MPFYNNFFLPLAQTPGEAYSDGVKMMPTKVARIIPAKLVIPIAFCAEARRWQRPAAICQSLRLHGRKAAVGQLGDELADGDNLLNAAGVGAASDDPVGQITVRRIDQGIGDTIWRAGGVAVFETAIGAIKRFLFVV